MDTLVDLCDDLASMAPTGMAEYLKFNFGVFKASNEAMRIIDNHSRNIEKYAEEATKEWGKTINRSNSNGDVRNRLWNDTRKTGPDAVYLRTR